MYFILKYLVLHANSFSCFLFIYLFVNYIFSDLVEDILSPDDGSCNSSHVSNKSEKNLADFDGEESGCEDELAQLAAHAQAQLNPHPMTQRLTNMACIYTPHLHGSGKHSHPFLGRTAREVRQALDHFELDSVCEPGQTLLWDLLQDDKIVSFFLLVLKVFVYIFNYSK